MKKMRDGAIEGAAALLHYLNGRWLLISELAAILGCSKTEAYRKLTTFAQHNDHCTLLVKDSSKEASIILFHKSEWHNLLSYLRRLPKK